MLEANEKPYDSKETAKKLLQNHACVKIAFQVLGLSHTKCTV